MRQTLAIATGKAVLEILHRTGRGGTALPGLVAERLDPGILGGLAARLSGGAAMITGTNGKTTTTRLLYTILTQAGLKVVNNRSGSNLIRGLTSTLLDNASFGGRVKADMGLFEVDEAAFPLAVAEIAPKTVLLNNLFRDQLDRYGEIDTVRKKWAATLQKLPGGTNLVLNADDPSLAYLARFAPEGVNVRFFGLDAPEHALEKLPHAVDASRCVVCAAPLRYIAVYISHMGHYHCDNCGFTRPQPDFVARQVKLNGTLGSSFVLDFDGQELALQVGVPGLYNVYNATGASAAALTMGLAPDNVQAGLAKFKAAFGRIERVEMGDGKSLLLALVKNPVGFNEVLRMLLSAQTEPLAMMIAINDLDADGRDVSWLWDVDFEVLAERVERAQISGIRAQDMTNRLKYAGLSPDLLTTENDLEKALTAALAQLKSGQTLYLTPTYTAMLAIREILQKQGRVVPFWEE